MAEYLLNFTIFTINQTNLVSNNTMGLVTN